MCSVVTQPCVSMCYTLLCLSLKPVQQVKISDICDTCGFSQYQEMQHIQDVLLSQMSNEHCSSMLFSCVSDRFNNALGSEHHVSYDFTVTCKAVGRLVMASICFLCHAELCIMLTVTATSLLKQLCLSVCV